MNVLITLAALVAFPALAQAQDREVVTVNGAVIRQSEIVERLWRRYGQETLAEMVDELLMRQAVAADKIKADPALIEQRISRIRRQFPDPKMFEAQLQQMGKSIDAVRAEVEEQIKFERLVVARKKLTVADPEVKKAFEQHKAELATPEAVQLRHILVATRAEADDLVAKIKGGADFKALAREKSLAPTGKINGGEYGWVARGVLPAEIEKASFALKEGEMNVLQTEKGFHILQALAKRASTPAEFSKVKEDLKDAVLQEKIRAALPDVVKTLREKAAIKSNR